MNVLYMQVRTCSWSPDGTMVVSCSSDKTMRVWDVSRGECINTLTGHNSPVSLHVDAVTDSFTNRLTMHAGAYVFVVT
jgi:WD40 repeat protein